MEGLDDTRTRIVHLLWYGLRLLMGKIVCLDKTPPLPKSDLPPWFLSNAGRLGGAAFVYEMLPLADIEVGVVL